MLKCCVLGDKMEKYYRVYDFTNENVACLERLYNFKGAKVLSVVGSGDQYFASILNGAKKIDLFDLNPTSYLYFVLKFFSIRELAYEEFYDFLILKNFNNINVYKKLESVLPKEILKYYKYLMMYTKNTRKIYFKKDGIDLFSKKNQKYYFENDKTVIPYFIKDTYYLLQEKLKNTELPNFFQVNLLDIKSIIKENYDILLASNIFDYVSMTSIEYVKKINEFDIPEIQVCYDWFGLYIEDFTAMGCSVNRVLPSSVKKYGKSKQFVYSLKK